ncbi:MAG: hypothetical protein FWD68_19340, partial [Alphaproteobacteria bacterium]|nr:hypothetical protein [Alphaproteobacteria bacterium]
IYLVQDKVLQQEARDILALELQEAANPAMPQAVKDASFGPRARTRDLQDYGVTLLAEMPPRSGREFFETWLVKAEAWLTQIDAGFATDKLPEDLAKLRQAFLVQSTAASEPQPDGAQHDGAQ